MAGVMISANEARQNPIRETIVHDEARGIESAILNAVKNGLFQTTVTSGTPMTSGVLPNIEVESVNTELNQLYVPNHPFKTGDLVGLYSDSALPVPLKPTDFYAIIYVDENHVKLASTKADAYNARPISIDFTVGVIEILLTNPGSGYFFRPQVTIEPSSTGVSATAFANLASYGSIANVNLLSKGSGYTDVPNIVFQPQGNGAVVNVIKLSAVEVSVSFAGTSYRVGDILSVVGGIGTATTVTVTSVTNTGGVATVALHRAGLYTSLPQLIDVPTTALPSGGTDCTLNLTMGVGGLAIDLSQPGGATGSGYVAPPVVIISSNSGFGAEAEAVVSAGKVVGFNMLHLGSDYTEMPIVQLSTGSGTVATAIIHPTSIGNISLTYNGGETYTTIPEVIINSQGEGAEAGNITMKIVTATISNRGSGYIKGETILISGGAGSDNASILITNVGSLGEIINFSLVTSGSYSEIPTLTHNAALGGSGQSASFNLTAGVNTITVTNYGLGYTVPPLVTITPSNGMGSGATAKSILYIDELSDIVVMTAGTGYTAIPTVSITSGSGATATAHLTPTGISEIIINNPGSLYTSPTLEFSGDGAGVQYEISLDVNGSITNIVITNPGSGFTTDPIITVVDETGGGAELDAVLVPTSISHISVSNGGDNYTCLPVIEITGFATATASLTSTYIDRIDITAEGTNWTSLPVIYTVPGANQIGEPLAPSASAMIGYSIKNITVNNPGSGYDVNPGVTITPSGGLGTPATAIAYVGAGSGISIVNSYPDSRDYFKVWKGMEPSDTMLTRPYQERMDTVISYFTNMGYTINRQTNPKTNNTIQWVILW